MHYICSYIFAQPSYLVAPLWMWSSIWCLRYNLHHAGRQQSSTASSRQSSKTVVFYRQLDQQQPRHLLPRSRSWRSQTHVGATKAMSGISSRGLCSTISRPRRRGWKSSIPHRNRQISFKYSLFFGPTLQGEWVRNWACDVLKFTSFLCRPSMYHTCPGHLLFSLSVIEVPQRIWIGGTRLTDRVIHQTCSYRSKWTSRVLSWKLPEVLIPKLCRILKLEAECRFTICVCGGRK